MKRLQTELQTQVEQLQETQKAEEKRRDSTSVYTSFSIFHQSL
jgi:hypothetical protein